MYWVNNTQNSFSLKQVTWDEVRPIYKPLNTELTRIIDNLSPSKKLPLLQVSYPFGAKILDKGKFVLPPLLETEKTGLSHQEIKTIRQWLSYATVPFGLFLKGSAEVYMDMKENVVPIYIIPKGYFVGLFEVLAMICHHDSEPIWDFTAGARSIFMLPKINNVIGHKRLQKAFNIATPPPKTLTQHWNVFVDLAQAAHNDWRCDIVFLTEPWFKNIHSDDPAWVHLREYLFRACWLQKLHAIEKTFSFILQQFSASTMKRRFKPRIYITDSIRHLMSIAYSLVPAFVPSLNEEAGPIHFIKKVYKEIYQLENYYPTIMEPAMLSPEKPTLYYSYGGYPTLLEGDLETENIPNTINDLKEIKLLIDNVTNYCKKNLSDIKKFRDFTDDILFDYFHKIADPQNEVRTSQELFDEDKNFMETNKVFSENANFCTTSPFLNGCIRIQRNFSKDSSNEK